MISITKTQPIVTCFSLMWRLKTAGTKLSCFWFSLYTIYKNRITLLRSCLEFWPWLLLRPSLGSLMAPHLKNTTCDCTFLHHRFVNALSWGKYLFKILYILPECWAVYTSPSQKERKGKIKNKTKFEQNKIKFNGLKCKSKNKQKTQKSKIKLTEQNNPKCQSSYEENFEG